MSFLLAAELALILLHRVDGGNVTISPSHITSLHTKLQSGGKVVIDGAGCVIWMDDGKFISVLETCETVKKLMNPTGGGSK